MFAEGPYKDRATLYAEHRWTYPAPAIDFLIERSRLGPQRDVAEVGSGTGALTEFLVQRVRTVYAIEPDRAMRAEAEARLSAASGFRSVPGTAEVTGLPEQSVDAVVAGQAVHWFSVDRALVEFRRVLRRGGRLGILWTETSDSPASQAIARLFERYPPPTRARPAAAHRELASRYIAPATLEHEQFPWHLEEPWDRFLGGLSSSAFAPGRSNPVYSRFVTGAAKIFSAYAKSGLVRLDLTTFVAVGPPRSP